MLPFSNLRQSVTCAAVIAASASARLFALDFLYEFCWRKHSDSSPQSKGSQVFVARDNYFDLCFHGRIKNAVVIRISLDHLVLLRGMGKFERVPEQGNDGITPLQELLF